MRLPSAEHFADGLALVGRQRSHEDQAPYALVLRARYDGAGIGVRGQHDRPLDPCQATIQGSDVVGNARQRNRSGYGLRPAGLERVDHLLPTRPIGPRAVNEYESRSSLRTYHETILFGLPSYLS
jgi:hypothetical protein